MWAHNHFRSTGFDQALIIPVPEYVSTLPLQLHHPLCQLDQTTDCSHNQFFIFMSVNSTDSLNLLLRRLHQFSPSRGFICTHLRLISASCQGPVSLPSYEIPHGLGDLTQPVSPVAPCTTPSPWEMLLSGLIQRGAARKNKWKEK